MSTTTSIVETQYGKVQGTQRGQVYIWKGIPFAQPPLGNLRFLPPQQPTPWNGVRDATHFGAIAAQASGAMDRMFGTTSHVPSGEDCLYLNIWSSGLSDGVKRPVMVWIHGGSFISGSGSTPWYDGTAFATNGDVVVVTINYRLGVFGFLQLPAITGEEYTSSGNCGLLDQIAALQWVRDNIVAFGGDPENVTVFGESAGAMSIGALLGMPAAQGLFHRAILQSGACHTVARRESAEKIARTLFSILDIQENHLASLTTLSTEQLLEAQGKLGVATRGLAFRPVLDGVVIPRPPIEAVADGSAADVAILIGTNRGEMKLFTLIDANQAIMDEQVFIQLFGANAQKALDVYSSEGPEMSSSDAWVDFLTDRTFRIPAIRLAERQARHNHQTWMYRFDWSTPAFGGRLGACHALEIPFVWNNLDKAGVTLFTGDAPERQQVAEPMHSSWIAFAHTGDPNTSLSAAWKPYDIEQRATMIFNETSHLEDDPQRQTRQLWDGVI